jgi:hypothetical protein
MSYSSARLQGVDRSGGDESRCALTGSGEVAMNLHLTIGPVVALIAGVLILVIPRLLNYIVALYLIIIGLLGVFGASGLH